jgi:hypothetical protein
MLTRCWAAALALESVAQINAATNDFSITVEWAG